MTKPAFKRDSSTWQLYILLSFYGYLINILGPLTPYLRAELNTNYTTAGYHFSLFAVGMLLAGLVGDRIILRLGAMKTLWLSAAAALPGVLLILTADRVWISLSGAFLTGLLGSFIITTIPGVLAQKYGALQAVAFAEINAFASLASVSAPLLVGVLAVTVFGWRGALVLPFLLLGIYLIFQWKTIRIGFSIKKQTANPREKQTRKALPLRYWLGWLGILMVVAIEFCIVFWSSDYLLVSTELPANITSLSVSFFLSAMLVSRWLGSKLLERSGHTLVHNLSLMFCAVGFFGFWLVPAAAAKMTGLFLTGLGVGNLYPVALAKAISSTTADQTDTASARASLASGFAILLLPLLLGILADRSGLQFAYGLVPLLILTSFLLPYLSRGKQFGVKHEI